MTNNNFDKIEAYLTRQLSAEETVAFEQEIQQNKSLKSAVALQRLEHDAMNQMLENDLKAKMASWDKTPPPNPFEEDKIENRIPQKADWAKWATGLLLISLSIWGSITLFNNIGKDIEAPASVIESPIPNEVFEEDVLQDKGQIPNNKVPQEEISTLEDTSKVEKKEVPKKVPIAKTDTPKKVIKKPAVPEKNNRYELLALNDYGKKPVFSTTTRSSEGTSEKSAIDKASEAFNQNNYQEALVFLGASTPEDQSNVRYLRGHIYFQLKDYKKATTEFKTVVDKGQTIFIPDTEDAKWYLLWAYAIQLPASKIEFDLLSAQLKNEAFFTHSDKVTQLLKDIAKIE